jgi:hypothetical protein
LRVGISRSGESEEREVGGEYDRGLVEWFKQYSAPV